MGKVINFIKDEKTSETYDLENVDVLFSTKFTTKTGETRLLSLIKTDDGDVEIGVTKSFNPDDGEKFIDMSGEDTIYLCNDNDNFLSNKIKEWLEDITNN